MRPKKFRTKIFGHKKYLGQLKIKVKVGTIRVKKNLKKTVS